MHKVGVDERIVALRYAVLDGDVSLYRAWKARAPRARVSRDSRLHVRPPSDRDGFAKLAAYETNRARLARVEETEDSAARAVRARKH